MIRLSDRAAALTFIVLVLGVSLATARVLGGLVLAVSPLLVTVVMMLVTRDRWGSLGMGRLGLRDWPVALTATAGVSLLATVAVVGCGLARFVVPGGAWLTDGLALCVTGPILAFAEEIGWRGYLLPRLLWLGEGWALLVGGVVWVAWHLPYILLTPFYHHNGNLALFAGSVLAFSVLFGRLRLRSGSLWPAVLGHFAHNATFAWAGTYLISTTHPTVVNEYLAGDTGLFVLLGTAFSALLLGHQSLSSTASSRAPSSSI
ncbi:CPBP family intramembrane glutamic endopeptidase [Actinoplanes sp. HUAS TT8]|uniref:CPBP family intramembrane glutamic endopeptidase n=1 Tax=Actinoplanes sp. HUAS TT8 TaxID=3447453 RepID=UPI003F51DA13